MPKIKNLRSSAVCNSNNPPINENCCASCISDISSSKSINCDFCKNGFAYHVSI